MVTDMRSRVHSSTEPAEREACLLSSGPLPWQQEVRGPGFLALSPEALTGHKSPTLVDIMGMEGSKVETRLNISNTKDTSFTAHFYPVLTEGCTPSEGPI